MGQPPEELQDHQSAEGPLHVLWETTSGEDERPRRRGCLLVRKPEAQYMGIPKGAAEAADFEGPVQVLHLLSRAPELGVPNRKRE